MALLGVGIDIVDIPRIRDLRQKQGERFYATIFTPAEVEYCLRRANADECFAARFAAKEAVMKALGTGWAQGVNFSNIEVVRPDDGRPKIQLHGTALEKARQLGAAHIHLSLSHARDVAVAEVIIEQEL